MASAVVWWRRAYSCTRKLSQGIEQLIAPKLTKLRATYANLADKQGEVREALAIYKSIKDVEARRLKLESNGEAQKEAAVSEGDLPGAVAEAFGLQVETVLKEWHFPEAERVFFDSKSRDLMIAGKARTARGKGLRAITHAAFTIGLLQFCKSKDTPHPSFVILDTPLRAYREPEGSEDDLTGTDLNVKFYDYLATLPDDRQVNIVENTDPPAPIKTRPQVVMFSKNPHSGRYGLSRLQRSGKRRRQWESLPTTEEPDSALGVSKINGCFRGQPSDPFCVGALADLKFNDFWHQWDGILTDSTRRFLWVDENRVPLAVDERGGDW
jgi:hypothetical protein